MDYRGKKLRQLIGSSLFERQSVVAVVRSGRWCFLCGSETAMAACSAQVSHSHLFKTAFWGEEELLNCEFRG